MEKPEDIETLPLESVNPLVNLMVRDVATVQNGVRPGELDRDMSQRYLTLVANVEGEDMGRASRQVARAIDNAGTPPRGAGCAAAAGALSAAAVQLQPAALCIWIHQHGKERGAQRAL